MTIESEVTKYVTEPITQVLTGGITLLIGAGVVYGGYRYFRNEGAFQTKQLAKIEKKKVKLLEKQSKLKDKDGSQAITKEAGLWA